MAKIPSRLALMCKERRRFSQTMASEWQTAFVVSHKMPWCTLLTAVKNYNKSLEKLPRLFLRDRDQDQMFKTKTKNKTSWFKTRTFIFVLEAPRDQDLGLEDYITANLHVHVQLLFKYCTNANRAHLHCWQLCRPVDRLLLHQSSFYWRCLLSAFIFYTLKLYLHLL